MTNDEMFKELHISTPGIHANILRDGGGKPLNSWGELEDWQKQAFLNETLKAMMSSLVATNDTLAVDRVVGLINSLFILQSKNHAKESLEAVHGLWLHIRGRIPTVPESKYGFSPIFIEEEK